MIIHVINLKGSQVTQPFIGHKISLFDFEHRVNASLYRKLRPTITLVRDNFPFPCNSSSARDICSKCGLTSYGSPVVSLDEYGFTGIHPVYAKEDFSAQIKPSSCLYIPHHAIFWWKISRELNVIRGGFEIHL